MSEFDIVIVGAIGNLRQLQIVGNTIYGSNINSSANVDLYTYTIGSSTVSTIITSIPSNASIAINGNDIYTAVQSSPSYINGTIIKSNTVTLASSIYIPSTAVNVLGLIYNATTNKLISIRNANNVYSTITLTDGAPEGTCSYAETSFISSSVTAPTSIVSRPDNIAFILTSDGYISRIFLDDDTSDQFLDLNIFLGITIDGTNIYTQGLAEDTYLCFGLNDNNTATYTIYVLDISTLPPTIIDQYTAPTSIRSIVLYDTGIDYDIYYCAADITLYKSTNGFCFNEGTKIHCMNKQLEDEYIAIELLQIGDFVKTYKHGYRKVSKVITGKLKNNPKKWNMCMYKMAKTETNGLIEDLIVTGGHSILVDEISDEEQKRYDEMGISDFSKITIDNKRLLLSCVSNEFTPMQDNEIYTYYHLLLENNDDVEERFGIWANGILTETPNEKTVNKKFI